MSYNHSNGFILNEDQITSFLEATLRSVENSSEADIKDLNGIKKLFKKVPFSRRKYVTAMLIKQAVLSGKAGRLSRKEERTERREKPSRYSRSEKKEYAAKESSVENQEEKIEKAPRVTIDASLASTIFIGIGKNRHVFPRDLVNLLVSEAGIERKRIGDIKVLASYSFVTLFSEDCQKVIDKLNGYDYRGRKLSVSFSRQKDGDSFPPLTEGAEEEAENPQEETIPANVTNQTYSSASSIDNSETAKIAAEQTAFAATMKSSSVLEDTQPSFRETTEDGQVRSHFGNGDAY